MQHMTIIMQSRWSLATDLTYLAPRSSLLKDTKYPDHSMLKTQVTSFASCLTPWCNNILQTPVIIVNLYSIFQ